MPELPEVETVRRALIKHVLNRQINEVEILYDKLIKTPLEEFKRVLTGAVIIDIKRIGKYLIFMFNNDYIMLSHLRMEGKYFCVSKNQEITKHTHIVFHLDNDQKLLYDDSRKFGVLEIYHKDDYLNSPSISKLGPEPFYCDPLYLFEKLQKCTKEIKSALLDQTIISGLGNIYVDETLYACNINPYLKANQITFEQCKMLLKESIIILEKSIKKGGSTISSYHPEAGVDGKFQIELLAYGKQGKNCPKCNHLFLKDFCHGRGTTYCPHCQNVALKIGLCGEIAVGKTTVLQYYKNKGYPVFSSDECVKDFYKTLTAKKFFIELFGESVLNDDGKLSLEFIKNQIILEPSVKMKIEKYVHPYVCEQIKKFINSNRLQKAIFIEVPLMFESNSDKLMDYIIGIKAPLEQKINNLKTRGSKNYQKDLNLNKDNHFIKYQHRCDYLIINDGSIAQLYQKCDDILESIFLK